MALLATSRCAVGLLVFALVAGCSTPEERFAEHVQRAERHSDEGDYEEALLEYQNALKIEPDNAEILERMGDVLQDAGTPFDAAMYYRQAHRLDPMRTRAAVSEAEIVVFTDPQRAEALMEAALEQSPQEPFVFRALSNVALARNDVEKAIAAANSATELGPGDPLNWHQLGRALQGRIRRAQLRKRRSRDRVYADAIAAFARADEIAGGDVAARVDRARVLGSWHGHEDAAVEAFRDAIALAKQREDVDVQVFAAYAMEHFARRRMNLELRHEALSEVVSIADDEYDAWDKLARLADGKIRSAGNEVYLELLVKRPNDPLAHLWYSNYLIRRNRDDEARAHLETTLADGVESAALWEQLVRLHLNTGNAAEARAAYVRMEDEFSDASITRRARARLAIAEKRPDQAAEILRELSNAGENHETERLLALAELRIGNLPEATEAIARAARLADEPSPQVLRLKARIHAASADWAGVADAYRVLLGRGKHLRKDEKVVQARALYGIGEEKLALAVLEEVLRLRDPPPEAAVEFAAHESATQQALARVHLESAFARRPANVEILEALTDLDVEARGPAAALARLDSVVESGRARPETLLLRARLLADSGQLDRAEADVLRAFEADPLLDGAVDLLYAIYERQGRLDEARRSFEEAEAAGVLHSGARLLLARFYRGSGEIAKARATLDKVVADHPAMTGAKLELVLLIAQEGEDLDRADELARELMRELGRTPTTVDTVGYVYHRQGRHEAALKQFRQAIALAEASPGGLDPIYPYHLGLALRALDREEEAMQAFQQALGIDSGFPDADDARRQLEAMSHPEDQDSSRS